ncbi:hypothetical protein FYK55_16965 [Roseiconus nitratireducens]|uniref:Uncharacterized protein n=1 Tax=Roseiconus nitratireducens TaxID=2605748 RepID=A0A5M6D319_9BACT|nr:hypothetical protein [Roseiconus nitratireducens]KAA5541888.1 hypothetical protein FYK55_16965 [Roseiconus nitratireducens]
MIHATRLPNPLIIQPPTGRSKLGVFEFDPRQINSPKGIPANPVDCGTNPAFTSKLLNGTKIPSLIFDAWPFFHAAAKTELARSFSAGCSVYHGMAITGVHGNMVRWDQPTLRIRRGGILSRKDASRTYLSSRFGEACAYLFMKDGGFHYWDHLPSLVDRVMGIGVSHPESVHRARVIKSRLKAAQKKRNQTGVMRQPDFVFEKPNNERALVESKGRMITPGKRPRFKRDLREALSQICVWQSLITGKIKAYGIGTYLREVGDQGDESLLAYVDPPGNNDDESIIEFPDDAVRRGNFGAWLNGMGLSKAAYSLAFIEERAGEPVELPVIKVANLDIAISVTDGFSPWLEYPMIYDHDFNFFVPGALVLGIELSRMRVLESAISNTQSLELLELPDLAVDDINFSQIEGIYGSVFPDGSFFGLVRGVGHEIRSEVFKL